MNRSLYITAGQVQAGVSEEDVPAIIAAGEGLLWIDMDEWSAANVALLRDVFHFHPLAIEDCFNDRVDNAKIDDYGSYLFIVSQNVGYLSRSERVRLVEIALFIGKNYVVTVHQRNIPAVDELHKRALQNDYFVNRGASSLAHAILDVMVDELLPVVEQMDEQLDGLERRILDTPDRAQLREVLLLKRNALYLRRAILSQRDMINRLSRGDFPALIPVDALIFYRDIYDHILRVESMLDGLRDLADGALNSYLSAVNNRMNEVMRAMSVVSVIFLPLTLIASIFGTNLEYAPWGGHLKWGFYLMLACMLGLAGLMILHFRRRGWF